ncbi:hypothetical protein Q5762_12505 [Streptomyces sp. P9(2023)]|uniref:hypothetical protein n=1 Tax=Streptomyces sp. P9(2023) TaxID=3064394 RepID=UPI0028F3F5DC|nr:hypothetical protein [Streptomyces sp. P9(2023)]MDT9689147.1 hypothetical protein [Streptomyces sp. P9(2023)]
MTKRYKARAMVALMATLAATLLATSAPAQAAADPSLELSNFELRPLANKAELQGRVDKLKADLPNIGVNYPALNGQACKWSAAGCRVVPCVRN